MKGFFIKQKNLLFVLSAWLLLTMNFTSNTFKSKSTDAFNKFERFSEALVVGRLVIAEREGLFSRGGFTGMINDAPAGIEQFEYQYDIYTKALNADLNKFWIYKTQTGTQALFFAALAKSDFANNSRKLVIFRFLTAMLSAFVLSIFLFWISKTFNLYVAVGTLVLILFSGWVTVFGRNLWWQLWSFYTPFVVILMLFYREHTKKIAPISMIKLFIISFLAVLLKTIVTGMEYITTVLIMFAIPAIFYAIKDSQNLKFALKRLSTLSVGAVVAIFIFFVILSVQISTLPESEGKISAGYEHIKKSFTKRAHGSSSEFSHELIKKSLDATTFEVVKKYLKNRAFAATKGYRTIFKISFSQLMTIFAVFSLILATMASFLKNIADKKRTLYALLLTTWLSISAPLSWFVIFKGHSYIHTHMNFIVWYMPFAFFGFIVISSVFTIAVTEAYEAIKLKMNLKQKITNKQ